MLKIPHSKQLAPWDRATIEGEPIASIDLMERACKAFVTCFIKLFPNVKRVGIVCGPGNNGGDGLGIARLLVEYGYVLTVWTREAAKGVTDDFRVNLGRLPKSVTHKILVDTVHRYDFARCEVLVDALFGSGLSRPLEGLYQKAIHALNAAEAARVAVDMPSGLPADAPAQGAVFRADHTIAFQAPKKGFFMPENDAYVGVWTVVDIGLSASYYNDMKTACWGITAAAARRMLTPRRRFAHKGDFGKGLLIAGSYGAMGACTLAAQAAMRAGLGLLTVHTPQSGYDIIQIAAPEAMASIDPDERCFSACPDTTPYTALAVGPGLGQGRQTQEALAHTLKRAKIPLVIDADALNLIAADRALQSLIPEGSILTPHPGELKRLIGGWKDDFERLKKTQDWSRQIRSITLIKGAYTTVCAPDGQVYFNLAGNAGMATAGSGDALTGVLLALLARGLPPLQAALLGVYAHGLAGDLAAAKQGHTGLIASDIITRLPKAFSALEASKKPEKPAQQ